MHDSTTRFTLRVADYVSSRPGYPAEALDWIQAECGATAGTRCADMGAGTGIFTALLLERGFTVDSVEPNKAMREAAEEALAAHPRFRSVDGTAEASGLADASVDCITAAQAFHWFDRPAALREFRRVLKPRGTVFLVWNRRLTDTPFLQAYEAMLRTLAEYRLVNHQQIEAATIRDFLGPTCRQASFPNAQSFDLAGLLGRFKSSSYVPAEGTAAYAALRDELEVLFRTHARKGQVRFNYETEVWAGSLY